MEKHMCKICCRKFSNGRALGGHMRSHMMNLPSVKLMSETESASSSSEDADENGVFICRRNNVKLADLEDRESETESTRTNPTRRRSKRVGKQLIQASQRLNSRCIVNGSELHDGEQVSSVSEVTSEEDLAFCLMMLSRDTWSYHEREFGDIINGEDDVTYMKRFRCETCDKVFKSYQALGGHRSSHKKTKVAACSRPDTLYHVDNTYDNNNNNNKSVGNNFEEVKENQQQKKLHECPICFRVFKSGQALGGHKRSHGIGIMESNNHQPLDYYDDNDNNDVDDHHQSCKKMKKKENILIDLNLPAPVEDEEISQIALSTVSYAHV